MNEILSLEQFLCSNRHLDYLPWTLSLSHDTENILVASQNDTCNILNKNEPTQESIFGKKKAIILCKKCPFPELALLKKNK